MPLNTNNQPTVLSTEVSDTETVLQMHTNLLIFYTTGPKF